MGITLRGFFTWWNIFIFNVKKKRKNVDKKAPIHTHLLIVFSKNEIKNFRNININRVYL